MSIKYGFIASQLSKGYTIAGIRKSLGMSAREDLNQLMIYKIRGDLSPQKRWKVLKRDKFRCVLCGADATDRKLHIDHIVPACKGGQSKIENLRVLCQYCNLGRNDDLKKQQVEVCT